jgi:hypothetical protein
MSLDKELMKIATKGWNKKKSRHGAVEWGATAFGQAKWDLYGGGEAHARGEIPARSSGFSEANNPVKCAI